jgi:ferrous iron transport protein B
MNEAVVHFHPPGRLAALVGNPNAGKTALFNRLTGSNQKVANYAGVTIERKEGRLTLASGKSVRILDLPGTYSLHPRSPDERITCEVLLGRASGEKRPDLVVCVLDATNLRRGLHLVLGVKRMGLPCVVALNMADLAASRGIRIDADALSRELGVPVVSTVAVHADGDAQLRELLERAESWQRPQPAQPQAGDVPDHEAVRALLQRLNLDEVAPHLPSDRIDRIVLHPVVGPLLLAVLLFLVFQAVFAWAAAPMAAIEAGTAALGNAVGAALPAGLLRSFLIDGLIAGVGGVLVFLPQILILFFFILVLEESGYLPRAAFLLDRIMGGVGLSGRSFIPLLSSFACAIPGIMATRTISNPRDRLVTIMIAPLMTCSARLPVYALLIGAFIPHRTVGPGLELQGLVLFALYAAGVLGAPADDGAARIPPAPVAQRGTGPVAAGPDLPAAGRRDHPGADRRAVVPRQLSRAAGRRRAPGHRIQRRRHAGPCAGSAARAHRLQLADQYRAGARPGGARGGRRRPGNGLCAVRHRQ